MVDWRNGDQVISRLRKCAGCGEIYRTYVTVQTTPVRTVGQPNPCPKCGAINDARQDIEDAAR